MLSHIILTSLALALTLSFGNAFTVFPSTTTSTTTTTTSTTTTRLSLSSEPGSSSEPQKAVTDSAYLQDLSQQNPEIGAEPRANPDRPELPEIPGDYDWDAKYAADADWVTDPNQIPGKRVLSELELAQQAAALGKLEDEWRSRREAEAYEDAKKVGFVAGAELLNGRTAMFFLVTGLLTEYWTGVSLPGQVEEMLRITGVIGFE